MLTSEIIWHNAGDELPERSDNYIVKTFLNMSIVPYSSIYKLFNTRDHYDAETIGKTAFEAEWVEYWAELPEFPVTESEGA